jgi:formylmethanofuran dehydrogenase subunit A
MAGAIDLHTAYRWRQDEYRPRHAAGRSSRVADRAQRHHSFLLRPRGSSTLATGYRYAQLGYTACFEPALLPANARQAHMEMGDIPNIDRGGYAMLGNDDFLLRLLAEGAAQKVINDYVAWTLDATQCIGIKVVNPGGINAFKFNARKLDLDEQSPHYRVTPRRVLGALSLALHELGVPHPLHVHGCNLGVPGNVDTTLSTISGSEGLPLILPIFNSTATAQKGRASSPLVRRRLRKP